MSQLFRGNLAATDLGGKYLSLLRVYTGELRLVKPYSVLYVLQVKLNLRLICF